MKKKYNTKVNSFKEDTKPRIFSSRPDEYSLKIHRTVPCAQTTNFKMNRNPRVFKVHISHANSTNCRPFAARNILRQVGSFGPELYNSKFLKDTIL